MNGRRHLAHLFVAKPKITRSFGHSTEATQSHRDQWRRGWVAQPGADQKGTAVLHWGPEGREGTEAGLEGGGSQGAGNQVPVRQRRGACLQQGHQLLGALEPVPVQRQPLSVQCQAALLQSHQAGA